jgi:hypothetical protein
MKLKFCSAYLSVLAGLFLAFSASADGKQDYDDHYDTNANAGKNPNAAVSMVNEEKPCLMAEKDSSGAWMLFEKKDSVFEDYQDKRNNPETGKVTSLITKRSTVITIHTLGALKVEKRYATKAQIDSALNHPDSLVLDSTKILKSYKISSLWLMETPKTVRAGMIYLPKTQTVKDSVSCVKEKSHLNKLRLLIAGAILLLIIIILANRKKNPQEEKPKTAKR